MHNRVGQHIVISWGELGWAGSDVKRGTEDIIADRARTSEIPHKHTSINPLSTINTNKIN